MEAPIRGHLGKEPELIETRSGNQLVRLRIAQDTPEGQTTLWLDGEAWGDLAVRISQTLHSGDAVTGVGYWKRVEWTDKETQTLRSKNFCKILGLGPDLSRVRLEGKLVKPDRAPAATEASPSAEAQETAPVASVPVDPMDED